MEIIKSIDKYGTIRYKNEYGQYHREDGPAYEDTNGYKVWYINDKTHREDGPAVIYSNGFTEYCLNGIEYSLEDYDKEILKIKLKRIKDL